MKRFINSLYLLGTRKNCHKNWRNPLLFSFIRKTIEWTVIIIQEYHSCLSYKILSNILLSRMTPNANDIIGEYQCGFKRNRSTIGHVFSIWQILENKWEYNNEVCQLFINFVKSYNTKNSWINQDILYTCFFKSHIKFFRTYFYREWLQMQIKL